LAAVKELAAKIKPERIVLVGRHDAALVACFAVALDPGIHAVAAEAMSLSYLPLFDAAGQAINAASILPGLLKSFGDLPDVLAQIAPRKVLVAAPAGKPAAIAGVEIRPEPFSKQPQALVAWLGG
jgi:hypothetical protein